MVNIYGGGYAEKVVVDEKAITAATVPEKNMMV
jgi:hypothetical protein